MNTRQLQLFAEIARSGSLSGAAAVIGTDQPSLSRQVRLLEEELGAKLFFRTGRGVKLTDAGHSLLAIADRHLEDIASLRQSIDDGRASLRGNVSLGVVQFLGEAFVPRLLLRFRERFPDIRTHVTGGNSGVVHEFLLSGRIDIGIIYDAGRSYELLAEEILSEPTYIFGSPELAAEYNIDEQSRLPLARLAELPLILTSKHHGLRRAVDHQAQRVGVKLTPAFEIDNLVTIKALARAGAGFCVLPFGAYAGDLTLSRNYLARIVEPDISSVFSMVFARHRPLSPAAREFASMIRSEIRNFSVEQSEGWMAA